ncbi:MAG: glycosyltransferase family 9 protein [Planctomycetota bacterium]
MAKSATEPARRAGRVLITRSLGLGDLCTAIPALRAVRRAFPRHEITLAAPAWQTPIALRAGVDRVVDTVGLAPLGDEFRGVDVAVNLHRPGPESIRRLLPLQPARLISYRHPRIAATSGGPDWDSREHEVERWCRLLTHAGIAVDPHDRRLGVSGHDPVHGTRGRWNGVALHPGAAAPGRRWPQERFAAVARYLFHAGQRVVVTGSAEESDLCAAVVALANDSRGAWNRASLVATPPPISIAGKTGLDGLMGILRGARALIVNDTGVAHLAAALGTPSVVLFGPTSPEPWGPPKGARHRVLWKGRLRDPHAQPVDAGLEGISVTEVLRTLDDLIGLTV